MLSKMEDFDRSVRDELKLLSDTVTAVQDSIPSQVCKFYYIPKREIRGLYMICSRLQALHGKFKLLQFFLLSFGRVLLGRVVKWLAHLPLTRKTRVQFWSEAGRSPNHGVNGRGPYQCFEGNTCA